MITTDVLIVGGGLAGLSAAVTLCTESNLQVMLVERNRIGANAGIRAVFLDAVSEFGLEASVLQRYDGYIFASPSGACARFDYGQSQLGAVDYQRACAILADRALRRGLNLRIARADHWSPATPDAAQPLMVYILEGENIETQVLIDASGAAQWAARWMGFQLSPHQSVCSGEWLSECTVEHPSSFRFLTGNHRLGNGGGWFYPTGPDSASFGYSIVQRSHSNQASCAEGYAAAKREFQPYCDWVASSRHLADEHGVIPLGRVSRFVADRILIVGDAAGQANPWSVEGCRPALQNGRACAHVVLQAFARQRFDSQALAAYERQWVIINRERFWRAASVADVDWARPDESWDQLLIAMQKVPAARQLESLRENNVSFFEQVYAVGGYWRRQLVKWMRGIRAK